MFKTFKNIISVVFSFIKFFVIKLFRRSEFKYDLIERFSPATMINIHKGGYLKLGSKVRAHSGTRLSVTPGGVLEIGANTAFNYNCILVARKSIKIGSGVIFGPNVMVYDHDHDFKASKNMNGTQFTTNEIVIGNNVWIGAGTIILKGTRIGDNSVIGAGSVINGDIPERSVVYQKKETVIKSY